MTSKQLSRWLSFLPIIVSGAILFFAYIVGDGLPWPFHWFSFFYSNAHFILVIVLCFLFSGPLIFFTWRKSKQMSPEDGLPKKVWLFPMPCIAAFGVVASISVQLDHTIELISGIVVIMYCCQAILLFAFKKSK